MDQTRIKKRKESMILNALNNIVKYEIKNPELKRICFTYVDISRDKKTINVFVDYHDLNKIDSFVKKMNKNSGVFKGLLANKLKI
jgi:ribosome-binding factor A